MTDLKRLLLIIAALSVATLLWMAALATVGFLLEWGGGRPLWQALPTTPLIMIGLFGLGMAGFLAAAWGFVDDKDTFAAQEKDND